MVKRKRFKAPVDRISTLCDEVLGLILSLLPFKEAAATSILSRRWKYLWLQTTKHKLYFDGTELLKKMNPKTEPDNENERSKFVRGVDQDVAACCYTTLEEFGVYFDLTRAYAGAIDEWLRFAVSRKVKKLELILMDKARVKFSRACDNCYIFPYKEGVFPNNFRFIKKLSTHYVNVSGEALEFFLGNCPLLEQLSVSASGDLEALRVSGTSAAFKRLEISCCFNLTSVVVCNSNLESFKYGGRRIKNFQISNVPRLSEIWIGGELMSQCKHAVEMFSCVFPQIERLKVYFLFVKTCLEQTRKFFSSAELPNVKELVVHIRGDCNDKVSLLPLSNLIKAAPNVQKFVLEAPSMKRTGAKPFLSSTIQASRDAYCQQLKEVEFVGYHGVRSQIELLRHLLENFATIESIFVDTRGFNSLMFDRVYQQQSEDKMLARVYNSKVELEKFVPSRINLKIL